MARSTRPKDRLSRPSAKTLPAVFVGGLGKAAAVEKLAVYKAVREFTAFSDGDDPNAEQGKFTLNGQDYAWKIDYYDENLEFGSDNTADPSITKRVLSIFYADDY
jgi:Protein of unknown function (DUF3768)